MVDIVTRAGKGSPLTNAEVDANFTNLAAVPTPNDGTLTMAVSGTGLSGSASFTADQAGASSFTVTSNATSANTASAIVARDGSGNFSAGTITAALSGNATTATTLQTARTIALSGAATGTATSFNGGAAITIPVTALNASNLSTGTLPDARLAGTYSGITLQTNGGNTHNTTPNTGSPSTNDRTVFGLAQFKQDSSVTTGAIVFYAPDTSAGIMHRLRIEGMIYSGGPTVMCVVQGYRGSGSWSQTSKINLGITDVQVRLGVDSSGKNCVILGDVGTTWNYPMMAITHAMFSHSGTNDAYCKDWTVGLVTSLTGFTNVTATLSNTALNTDISGSSGSTTGNAATATNVAYSGLTGTVPTWNQNTTGTAAVATEVSVTSDSVWAYNYLPFISGSSTGDYALKADSGIRYNPSTNYLILDGSLDAASVTADSMSLGDNDTFSFGAGASGLAKLFANGATSTMQLELESAANSFIITDNGTTKFTFTKATGTIEATDFSGGGAALTSLTAANISAGTAGISISGNAATATTLQTARAINGVNFNGSAAITVEPYVEDAVATSVTRYITFVDNSTAGHKRLNEDANLSYNPGTNVLTVPTVSGALSGNATTATTLQTARTINGVSFNGSANITIADATKLPLTGGDLSGRLTTSENIVSGRGSGGVALTVNDGYGNANVTWNHEDGVPEQSGNAARIEVNTDSNSGAAMYFELKSGVTSGSAIQTSTILTLTETAVTASGTIYENANRVFHDAYHPNADTLTTARTIGGVSFNGSANINLPGVNTAGNQNTSGNAATATTLQTARTINGVSFNGSANITVADATKLPVTGGTRVSIGTTAVDTDMPVYAQIDGAVISGGNAISGSTMKGIRLQNGLNGDESVGLWFNTGGSHWSGISGQRVDSASGWGTDLRFYTHEAATNNLTYARERVRITKDGELQVVNTVTAPTFSGSLSGNATTATTLQTARTINGVSFNGSANITVEPYISNDDTGDTNCPIIFSADTTAGHKRLYEDSALYFNNTSNILYSTTFSGALSGNATTATTLQTARTIGGVSFNGSANINLPGVNAQGNQNTTGNAATCTNATNTNSISNATGSAFTWTGAQTFQSNLGVTSGILTQPPLQVYSTDNNAAFMSFHKGGHYAINMGLDSDNVLRIGGWSAAQNRWQLDGSGNMTAAGNVTAYSDERLKKDWEEVKPNFVDQLANVKSGTYTRTDSNERQAGVSAQSLQELLPETVAAGNDGMLSVAYGNAAMVAVVELAKEVRKLKEELRALKGE